MRFEALDGALSVTTSDCGLVRAVARGSITASAIVSAVEIAWMARSKPASAGSYLALLIDLRSAWMAEYESIPIEAAKFAPAPSMLSEIPCVLVMPERLMPMAMRACMDYATRGVVMGAFTEPAEAVEWVAYRAFAMLGAQAQPQTEELVRLSRRRACAFRCPESGQESDPSPRLVG